jgi:hypothetical protein
MLMSMMTSFAASGSAVALWNRSGLLAYPSPRLRASLSLTALYQQAITKAA